MTSLYIFDIDGTLMSAGGAGARAIDQVFQTHFGYPNICQHLSFAGGTDKNIFDIAQNIAATASGQELLPEELLFEAYEVAFKLELEKNNTCHVYGGVVELLNLLRQQNEAVLGIGTGNLKSTANLKLKYADLADYFNFGGYGSDFETRPAIFKKALARGTERLGQKPSRVVVFGDTPKDIWAAKDIGAEVVAVTTGTFDRDGLTQENPDLVVDALNAPELAAWLGAP